MFVASQKSLASVRLSSFRRLIAWDKSVNRAFNSSASWGVRSVARALPGGGGEALRAAASAACLAACLAAQGAEPLGPPRLVSGAGVPRVELTDGTAPLGFASRTPGLDSFLIEVAAPRAVGTERTTFPAFIVDFAIVRSHAQTQGSPPRRFDLASVIHLKANTGQIRILREPGTLKVGTCLPYATASCENSSEVS